MTPTPGRPRPPLVWPLGALLAPLYSAVIRARNRRFDAGRGVVTLDRPVISVGNLSVGGTGKTPLVVWIVQRLRAGGHSPCIAMRGYAARGGASDEAEEYRRRLTGVPVVMNPNRVEGLLAMFGTPAGSGVDCVVLDDGFQHRRVARQLDIVLIDATRGTMHDRVLPAGWLREPAESLSRAGFVVITHAECASAGEVQEIVRGVSRHSSAPVAVARHEWVGLTVRSGDAEAAEPVEWLRERAALPVCAIGNPGPFLDRCASAMGSSCSAPIVLRDHDPYGRGTLRRVLAAAGAADAVVTTEKDWSKLTRVRWPCPVARPRLELRFDSGERELLAAVLGTARNHSE